MSDKGIQTLQGHGGIAGEDSIEGKTKNVKVEPDVKGLRIVPFVYDTETLGNVRMIQPSTSDDLEKLFESYYKDNRFEVSGTTKYIGRNIATSADVDATDWIIQKITIEGGYITRIQFAVGSWTNRGDLF